MFALPNSSIEIFFDFLAASDGGNKSSKLFDFPFKVKLGSSFRRSKTKDDLKEKENDKSF